MILVGLEVPFLTKRPFVATLLNYIYIIMFVVFQASLTLDRFLP